MSKEKREARAERFRELAAKAEQRSTAAYNASNNAVSGIPPGQPILVGHHSEKRHRRALERSWSSMGRSVKESDKAEYYRNKAEAAENNDAIYTEDDDAVERLEEKIAKLTESQERMKQVNKLVRSKKETTEQKKTKLIAIGFSEATAGQLIAQGGYPSYKLTNNNANLRTTKQRLEHVRKLKEMPSEETVVNGYRVELDTTENRFRIYFDGKPDDETRQRLKRAGFRWSPSNGAWQCYIKRWNIEEGKEILRSLPHGGYEQDE